MHGYRDLVLYRVCDSNEDGLILSIPFPVFYNFADGIDIQTISIELQNFMHHAFCEVYITLDSQRYMIIAPEGYADHDNYLYIAKSDKYTEDYKRITFGLYLEMDHTHQRINIYDAFYCTGININKTALLEDQTISFQPFMIRNMYARRAERPLHYDMTESNRTMFMVDSYSGLIKGIAAVSDFLFTPFNNAVVENKRLEELGIHSAINLINRYRFMPNGEIVEVDYETDELVKKQVAIKNATIHLRNLQAQNTTTSYVADLMTASSIEDVQNAHGLLRQTINDYISFIQNEAGQIADIRDQIYQDFCKEYLEKRPYKYYCSACLLIKDENDYIQEWMQHHLDLGIEHFYIYDNMSAVPVEETIKSFNLGWEDKCTFIRFSDYKRNMQFEAYQDCLARFGHENLWMTFIDTDEFIEFNKPTVQEFLSHYESNFCIWLPWELYNAGGRVEKSDKGMKETFTNVIRDPHGLWGKVFLQPHRTQYMFVHLAIGRDNCEIVINADGKRHIENYNRLLLNNPDLLELSKIAKVRHYVTRSFEEWCDKISRGSCDPNFCRKFNVFFEYNPDMEYLKEEQYVKDLLDSKQPYT